MNWNPPAQYAQLSKDGRYSVCKVGHAKGYTYEAWRCRAHPDGPGLIATGLPTAEAARQAAQNAEASE